MRRMIRGLELWESLGFAEGVLVSSLCFVVRLLEDGVKAGEFCHLLVIFIFIGYVYNCSNLSYRKGASCCHLLGSLAKISKEMMQN